MTMDNEQGTTQYDEVLAKACRVFAINEEDAWEARHWVESCTDLMALETLYEVLGETELQQAYLAHMIEERCNHLRS
jgi:hypothetical protein